MKRSGRWGVWVSAVARELTTKTRSCHYAPLLLTWVRFSSSPGARTCLLSEDTTSVTASPLFADGKEELGLDHSQVMSAQALLRLWTLALLASVFLEQEHHRVRIAWPRPVTSGEARREIQRRHRRGVLEWLHHQILSGLHPENLFDVLAA